MRISKPPDATNARHAGRCAGGIGHRLAALAAAAVLGCLAPAATAASWQTFVVDDSMTQVLSGGTRLNWRTPTPSRHAADQLTASVSVDVVLNLTPWVGKLARIYMVMPPLPQSTLTVQWTTRGLLMPGQLSGGQRQLVFQGVVPGARLEDLMRVTALANAGDPTTPPRVNFTFEIEVQGR